MYVLTCSNSRMLVQDPDEPITELISEEPTTETQTQPIVDEPTAVDAETLRELAKTASLAAEARRRKALFLLGYVA